MMRSRDFSLLFLICGWWCLPAADAAPPLKIGEFATIEVLVAEVEARLQELEPLLAGEDAFLENKKRLEQLASMAAVTAQAIAEHEQDSALKPFMPDLRDAALKIANATDLATAMAELNAARAAQAGTSGKSAVSEVDWAKLVKQRPIMEEMEVRMMQLQRILRRPKDLPKESRHAAAIAVSNLTTLVDTHEVKDPAKLPEWDKLSRQMLTQLKELTTAMQQNQPMEAQAHFKAARATCVECHRQFKKEQ